jgi:hypothetical protein
MKTVLKIVIANILGLLLAGEFWLVACIPQDESVPLYEPPPAKFIQVNVVGAVKYPGIYEFEENRRVVDAVEAAGGFVIESDISDLNLAAFMVNGQTLDIPFKEGTTLDVEMGETPSLAVSGDNLESNPAVTMETHLPPDIAATSIAADTVPHSCSDGATGTGDFVWPADNHFLSGNDYEAWHPGIDIAAGEQAPVYAVDSGTVTAMGNDEAGYGNVILLDHGNGYITVYAHLSDIGVSMCQSVYAGQEIGAAGNTGNSRGVHLHFEVVQDGESVNPWFVLP